MADQLFATSPYGKALFNAYGARRPTIAILGDSSGLLIGAAIQYACAKYYAADIHFDHREAANGGRMFATGGTSSTQMVSTQVPQFQSNPADVAFIMTGGNNPPTSSGTVDTVVNDITTAANACLLSGAKLVVICGQNGKASTAQPWAVFSVNTRAEAFARNTPGVMFLDITSAVADPAATSGIPPRGGTAGTQGSYTADGTHWSAHAVREAIAPLLHPVLRRIARQRIPRTAVVAGQFDPSGKPDIEILGDASLMNGTSGRLNGSANAGVAGESYAKWEIITSGGATVTPSIVVGADGFKRQRLALSGTMSANGYVLFECTPTITNVNNSNAARLYDAEAVVELSGVTGLCEVLLRCGSTSLATMTATSVVPANPAHLYPNGADDGPLFYYNLFPVALSGNNPTIRVACYFPSGATLGGNIDISRVSCRRVAP